MSKLLGEWFAADASAHYILRVESLFGGPRAKSSVDRIIDGVEGGQPVRVFTDRTVTPSYVNDVAEATARMLEIRPPVRIDKGAGIVRLLRDAGFRLPEGRASAVDLREAAEVAAFFSDAAKENGMSRVYGGIHFQHCTPIFGDRRFKIDSHYIDTADIQADDACNPFTHKNISRVHYFCNIGSGTAGTQVSSWF